MLFYSAQNGAFYDAGIHGDNIPEDAVEITRERHRQLITGQSEKMQIVPDDDGYPVLSQKPVPNVTDRRNQARINIDKSAGAARARYISAGQLITEEYVQAEQAVKDWREAGSPAGDVPTDIQTWADASGMTVEEAAADIEQTSQNWRSVISTIRQIRLSGKAAVDAAEETGTRDDMQQAAQPYIDQLEAMQP